MLSLLMRHIAKDCLDSRATQGTRWYLLDQDTRLNLEATSLRQGYLGLPSCVEKGGAG